ncbi:UNVERIFIED_CONTAM: hypothetical protein Sradi_4528700 [Sesamum radiatum]|uniref:Uncharacterized protein n=1 Tax=Sesamum radiatum TaxID=300843 RepID=A0AAW2NB73_SESRA
MGAMVTVAALAPQGDDAVVAAQTMGVGDAVALSHFLGDVGFGGDWGRGRQQGLGLGLGSKRKLNKLLESKCPDEAGRVNDPEYCKYHQVVSHPIERCFVVKEKIIALAKEGKIIFDIKEAAGTNVANISATNNRYVLEGNQEFGSFEPIQTEALFVEEEKKILTEDDDGWILVTHRQRQRRHVNKLHPSLPRKPRCHKYPHHANAKNKIEKMSHQRLPVSLEEFFP